MDSRHSCSLKSQIRTTSREIDCGYLHLVLKLVNFSRLALGPSTESVAMTLFTLSW